MVDDLMYLYPTQIPVFDLYEDAIYDIIPEIKEAYIRSFIKKERTHFPQEEYQILKKLHKWHIEDRAKNRINIRIVREIINSCDASVLNRMIRRYLQSCDDPDTKYLQPRDKGQPHTPKFLRPRMNSK